MPDFHLEGPRNSEKHLENLTMDQRNDFSTDLPNAVFPDALVGYSPDMDVLEILSPNCSKCLCRLEEFPTFTWCDRCEIEVDFEFASFQVKGPK